MTELGHTGEHPDGQLTADDEGELVFEVGDYEGRVVLNFAAPIHTLGLTAEQAEFLADCLRERATYVRSLTPT